MLVPGLRFQARVTLFEDVAACATDNTLTKRLISPIALRERPRETAIRGGFKAPEVRVANLPIRTEVKPMSDAWVNPCCANNPNRFIPEAYAFSGALLRVSSLARLGKLPSSKNGS